MSNAETSKTLQELEDSDEGDPETGETPLIRKCLALRRKPIADFTVENLRLAIGQQMGLKFLVPLAMRHLERDPLSQGDFYPGDLLQSVLRVPFEAWLETEELRALWVKLPPMAKAFLVYADKMTEEERDIFDDLIKAAERTSNFH